MTLPRRVLAGTTYLITRRCSQREFLLRPSATTNAVFLYVLAVTAARHNIQVHGFCVLSNHVHLVVTDLDARIPEFQRDLNSLVARFLNRFLGRSESFWASTSSYSAVTLASARDVLEKAVYALANPVAAGLVRNGREWPGLWSPPEQLGSSGIIVQRPAFFFRPKGPMPETARLELTAPPGFESIAEFRAQLTEALAEREQEIAATMVSQGREFLGARRVLEQDPTSRPSSEQTFGALKPTIAARDKWKRIEALADLVRFRKAYREAWIAMRNRARDVVFPHGTYWLRIAHGVRCEAPA